MVKVDGWVLTVDIKESTLMSPEAMSAAHIEIDETMMASRGLFPDTLVAIGFTAGDEFEAVFRRPDEILKMLYYLRVRLSTPFRVGVGAGVIESPGDDSKPNQMWGAAFVRARDALNEAKHEDLEVRVTTSNKQVDHYVNTLLELINHVRFNLTGNQRRIIDLYNFHVCIGGMQTQRGLANMLEVSDAMISKTLKRSGYEQLKKGEDLVQRILCEKIKF